MKDNILFTATDKQLESYAVPMVMSFMKFNPDIPIYCVLANDVSDKVKTHLKHLGVRVLKHYTTLTTSMGHIMLRIPDYVSRFEKAICLDIDTLVLNDITELYEYPEDILAHPGFDKDDWIIKNPDGSPYFATAISVTYKASCELRDLYIQHGTTAKGDGVFLREFANQFKIRQLDHGAYTFLNVLIENAEYSGNVITYVHKGKRYTPKIAHFSKCRGGRCKSVEIDKWCLDNRIQVRCDCQS